MGCGDGFGVRVGEGWLGKRVEGLEWRGGGGRSVEGGGGGDRGGCEGMVKGEVEGWGD